MWNALWTFGSLASSKGRGIADRHGAFTQKLFKYSTMSKNYVFTTRPPCETGLYNWPCFTAGGSESQRRWATCRRSHKEAVAQQGCWTRILRQVQRAVNPLGSLLLTWVVGADQRMDGEKKSDLGLFFIQKKANYFSQGLLAAALTLSPQRIFWMFFLVCSAEFCVEGRGEAGELQSSLGRDWISYSREKVIWAVPKQGGDDLPLCIGPVGPATEFLYHSLPHPFPLTYACWGEGDKKRLIKGCLLCTLLPVDWGS